MQAEGEAAVAVAAQQAVRLEGDGQPVGRGPGQPGGRRRARPSGRGSGGHRVEHGHRLVQHADIAYPVFHQSDLLVSECETTQADATTAPKTLSQKVWDAHVVRRAEGEPDLLYIDLHLVHEVTSPQAFDGAAPRPAAPCAGPTSRSPPRTTTSPPRTPTSRSPTRSAASRSRSLRANAAEFGIVNFPMGDPGQGIVHVIGPEQGLTLPGMTIVCGDSHTSTHGAFGALAFGIGTSEVEHVLATQTLPQAPAQHDGHHRRRRPARPAARPRTSSSPSSAASAPAAASATSPSTAARPSGRSRWRAA